LLQVQW